MIPAIRVAVAAACGAAAMYWFDPTTGRRRRALLRDRLASARGDMADAMGVAGRDLSHRTRGLRARIRAAFASDKPEDKVLVERVRAALGRAVSHPRAIDVAATDGRVTLIGAVLAQEHPLLLNVVQSVRGVHDVVDELAVYENASGIPALQGGRSPRPSRFVFLQENWPPAARMVTGGVGGALVLAGARQLFGRNPHLLLGPLTLATGGVLLARSVTNAPLPRLLGRAGRRAVDVRKTLHVNAPIERVFDVLADHENFPSFMRNVRAVQRHPEGRSHWVVAGPGGISVEWDAETTAYVPHEVLAWRTVPDATVAHAGIIRFERAGDSTRLDVQMIYNPPGGVLGHAAAKVFGADPKTELDEDLMRLKTFLETGVPARDAARAGEGVPGEAARGIH